jgi:hypothetical protein
MFVREAVTAVEIIAVRVTADVMTADSVTADVMTALNTADSPLKVKDVGNPLTGTVTLTPDIPIEDGNPLTGTVTLTPDIPIEDGNPLTGTVTLTPEIPMAVCGVVVAVIVPLIGIVPPKRSFPSSSTAMSMTFLVGERPVTIGN